MEHKSIKEQHILIAYVPLLMHVHSLLLILLQTKVFAQFTYELRIRLFVWSTGLKINGKQYLGFVRWYKECCAALFLHERMWLATMNPVGATFIQTCAWWQRIWESASIRFPIANDNKVNLQLDDKPDNVDHRMFLGI